MKNHVKVYLQHFGYGVDDFIPCEVCGNRGTDIHHIDCRGMGGTKEKDGINNLMALCRKCHIDFGDKKHLIQFLKDKHETRLNYN